MDKYRAFPKRQWIKRFAEYQEQLRIAQMLHGPAWADAWPHLDDWFNPQAFFIGQDEYRPGIA